MQPDLILVPFAQSAPTANVDAIPVNLGPTDPPQAASWSQGFPTVTMTPLAAGGIPPRGQSFNGVLNNITKQLVYIGGGGQYKWSSAYVTANGGYSIGNVIQSDSGLLSYVSLINSNTDNFNTNPGSIGSSWRLYSGAQIVQATESSAGIARIATQVLTNAGADDSTIITPKKLFGWVAAGIAQATETLFGFAKIATQAITNAGADDASFLTPKKLAAAVRAQAFTAITTTGSSPAFTITPTPAITAYAANQRFQVTFNVAGGATPTLNISGLGAKNLKQYTAGGAKVAAIIASGQTSDVVYDGTDLVVLDQLPNSVGVTPAQFDNSTNLATTAFVQGVGFQFSGTFGISAGIALTAATHAGGLIVSTGASAINVTLPLASTMPAKTLIKFWTFGTGTMTLIANGSDSILLPAANTTLAIITGSWVTLASNGAAGWYAIDSSSFITNKYLRYVSSPQAITPGGSLILAHGLPSKPTELFGFATCTVADSGYSVGDVMGFPVGGSGMGGGSSISVVPDSTNLNIRYGNTTYTFPLKTTGAANVINTANWSFTFGARV